jgi:hypothetical protein
MKKYVEAGCQLERRIADLSGLAPQEAGRVWL